MRNQHANSKTAFTLAELLLAIAIIGVMFAIALPAMNGVVGQTKLESASSAVRSAAKLARRHAVAKKQPTYLVFDTGPSERAFRAYAIFTIDVHSPPITRADGRFIKDWETLPAGVVFDPNVNFENNVFDVSGGPWRGGLDRVNELLIDGETRVVLGFKPNGQGASATHHVHLAEGAIINGHAVATSPGRGKQLRFTTFGKSVVMDYVLTENGEFETPGDAR